MKTGILAILAAVAALIGISAPAHAQSGPLRLEITEGVIEPMPIAIPTFVATSPAAQEVARNLTQVVTADLTGTGLFREIPANAYISPITDFSAPIRYTDWRTINAQALVTGSVAVSGNRLVVQFRIYDVFAGAELGTGLQFVSSPDGWRRVAHKVADAVYSRITGEQAYFDSRVVFVSESGPKSDRRKRLAIMDYDGQNVQYLTDSSAIVLNPRFSPAGDKVLYTSYESGVPRINVLDVGRIRSRAMEQKAGTMSFGPRFSPDGNTVIFSLTEGGNTDIYTMGVNGGNLRRLTNAPSIETAPSFSPDGSQIVFESDRSGTQQLYVMPAGGGEARRISFGQGRYGTPVWSPRGDLIAFTKQSGGRFHIGIMAPDGNNERLLTASFLDEGPTWAPNGRVIMFTRETKGADGQSRLYSIDITGRNLKSVPTPDGASDASWSPLQN